ncbi:MAG: hypothetical protein R3C16_10875 [Hyphomonadaceae bacterium]
MQPAHILHPRPEGLYCPAADLFIDPTRPVPRALITHGHSDHARAGHGAVLATAETLAIMAARYGEGFAGSTQALVYGERLKLGEVTICKTSRACARLSAGGGGGRRRARGGERRLQAPARPDLRAVRSGALRCVHQVSDVRAAGVHPSQRRR